MTQGFRRHPFLLIVVVVAAAATGVAVKQKAHSLPTGAATVQLMVDSRRSALADLKQDTLPLISRAQVFAQLMTSGAVLKTIATVAGVPVSDVTAEGPYSGAAQPLNVPTPSAARSVQLVATNAPYHFTFVADTNVPMVTASVQGPNPAAAAKLANAVYPGVESWLTSLEDAGSVPGIKRVTIRQLGDAQAGSVNDSSATTLAGIGAAAVLLIGFLGILAPDVRRAKREQDELAGMFDFPGPSHAYAEANGHGAELGDDGSGFLDKHGVADVPRHGDVNVPSGAGTTSRVAPDLSHPDLMPGSARPDSSTGPHGTSRPDSEAQPARAPTVGSRLTRILRS